MLHKKTNRRQPDSVRLTFAAFTVISLIAAIVTALLFREDMLGGLLRICTLSGQTVKSYFDPSYGGISGTFFNLFLVCLVMTGLYCLPGAVPNGYSAFGFCLTAGFCFWGMTILNIWFSFAGVALYALVCKRPLGSLADEMLFSTGLAPLITEMLFRYPFSDWHGFTAGGVLIALAVGLFIGFLLPTGLRHSSNVHKDYDLYSAALPMGFAAFFLRSLLYQVNGVPLPASVGVGLQDDYFVICAVFFAAVFGLAIAWGVLSGGWKPFTQLLRESGHKVDYAAKYGCAAACINFGVFGIFIVLYYCAVGATWNAATFGVVFCMVCAAFKGSHVLNVWPIMLGYALMSLIAKTVCGLTGAEFTMTVGAQPLVIGLCYAGGLSPVTGKFGWWVGMLLSMAHYCLVTCVPLLHGSFLLYNGGFTAAIVCILFIPVLEHFCDPKEKVKRARG